ncbi:MAG: histidinol dehydrogenase [Treponema sp.]|nr:histidinol dehydrogenase [Treponema sp.]
MIKIQNALDVEKEFFLPRDFSESNEVVKTVVQDVKNNGDKALWKYGAQFDKSVLKKFLISESDLQSCAKKFKNEKPRVYDALLYSFDMACRFAKKQRECFCDFEIELELGVFTGQKNIPVERAGVYVPAGNFPLISTVVMTVAPAIASGVSDIVLCTPPRKHPFDENMPYACESILAASYICGVKKVFACGGAQAVAAMAYGTESIPSCDVIVGPGNKFVAEAKKIVYGAVGIDMIAGPTEVFIIADENANAAFVAADLLAQAEHDVASQAVLATTSKSFAEKVAYEIEKQLQNLSTKEIAEKSIQNNGKIILVSSIDEAIALANKKAPEHLELSLTDDALLKKAVNEVRNYGSLFVGDMAAEVFGDYAAGINHTLPTSRSARFTGGLSCRSFLKTVTTLRVKEGTSGFAKTVESSVALANEEGLSGHAMAASLRSKM